MPDDERTDERIVLSMDRTTARDLYDELYAVGEHWAAGAEVPYPPPDVMARLGTVYRDLERALGIPSMAEMMQQELDRRTTKNAGQPEGLLHQIPDGFEWDRGADLDSMSDFFGHACPLVVGRGSELSSPGTLVFELRQDAGRDGILLVFW